MPRIPIPVEFQRLLANQTTPVELVDDAGKLVGHYLPPGAVAPTGDGWPTGEELEAMSRMPGRRYTAAEVLAHLRSLG